MRQIIVEPDRLDETAAKVAQADEDYERIYHSLYQQVDKMTSAWQGKDNTAFSDQIHAYEEDFRQISLIMRQYADFLHNSARAYRETQDELASQATHLRG